MKFPLLKNINLIIFTAAFISWPLGEEPPTNTTLTVIPYIQLPTAARNKIDGRVVKVNQKVK